MVLPYIFRISFAHCIPESLLIETRMYFYRRLHNLLISSEKRRAKELFLKRTRKKSSRPWGHFLPKKNFLRSLRSLFSKEKILRTLGTIFSKEKHYSGLWGHFFPKKKIPQVLRGLFSIGKCPQVPKDTFLQKNVHQARGHFCSKTIFFRSIKEKNLLGPEDTFSYKKNSSGP